jgi:hypothetical protein
MIARKGPGVVLSFQRGECFKNLSSYAFLTVLLLQVLVLLDLEPRLVGINGANSISN